MPLIEDIDIDDPRFVKQLDVAQPSQPIHS